MSISSIPPISPAQYNKTSLGDNTNKPGSQTEKNGRQPSQSNISDKKNEPNDMESTYLERSTVDQLTSGATTLSNRGLRQSRSVDTPLGTNNLQSGKFDQIANSNRDVGNLLAKQPTFRSATSEELKKELAKAFPHLPQPIDPDKIHVRTYKEELTSHTVGNGDGIEASDDIKQVSSMTLTEVLQARIVSGKTPTYNQSMTGFYSSPTGVFGENEITTMNAPDFEKIIDAVGQNIPKTYQQQLDSFWTTPNSGINLKTPKEWLSETRGAQLRAEADLRIADGTLKPESRALIDKVLSHPSAADRESLPANARPGVYAISLKGGNGSPDIPFSGAFVLTRKDGAGVYDQSGAFAIPQNTGSIPIDQNADAGSVLLYTPGKGIEEFDSLQELNQTLVERFDDADQRQQLLDNVANKDRDKARAADNALEETIPFRYTAIQGNVFQDRLQSQIDKQKQDVEYAGILVQENSQSAQENNPDIAEETFDEAADLSKLLDVSDILRERNAKLVEKNQPDWLKNASKEDRNALQKFEQEAEDLSSDLNPLLEKIPSLHSFTNTKIQEKLKQNYPNADIDPDKIEVRITTRARFIGGGRPAPGSSLEYTTTRTISLPDLALENLAPWDAPQGYITTVTMTAPLQDKNGKAVVDASGKPGVLTTDNLKSMVRELDVGQKYTDLLKQRLSPDAASGDAKALRDAWKLANTAKMKGDAFTAQLNPDAFSTEWAENRTKKRGSQWIDAVINHPDPSTRPTVERHPIVANYLTMGGANPRGGGGQVINGVAVISVENRKSVPSVVLYTPDAPDGIPFRELSNGPQDIDLLLQKPEWKQYFTQRMATNDKGEINNIVSNRSGTTSYALTPIRGNVQDAMYKERSGFLISHADHRSTSNAEVDRQSTFNKVMFGVDVADMLLDIFPFKKGASALRRVGGAALRNLRTQGRKVPGLISKLGRRGKIGIEVSASSITPLNPRKVNLTGYEVSPPLDRLTRKPGGSGIYDGPNQKEYVPIGDKWYESFTQSGERYIKHPTRTGDNVQLKSLANGQWTSLPRGGLGGAPDALSPKESARLTELRGKDQKRLTPNEKTELKNLIKKEEKIKKAQELERRAQASIANANKTQDQKISEINHQVDNSHPKLAKYIKDSNLSLDHSRLKNTSNVFYEKPPSVPVPDADYTKATVWYRAMTAEEFNALKKGQGFQQDVANGYGGITTSYAYAKKYYAKNDTQQTYLVQFTVRDKPLSKHFEGKIGQPKIEDGAVSYGLGAQGTPRTPNNSGGTTAGQIFNEELKNGNISYELVGLNIKLS